MKKIIVVGSGVLGASAAYHLSQSDAQVMLVDGRHPGRATDAAAGIICPWLSQRRNQSWYRLAKGGARYYAELTEKLRSEGESDTGYARVGALSLHTDPKKIEQMRERAEKRREDAPEIGEIEVLDEAQVRELFPLLNDGYMAVRVSGAARVDGRALRDAMISAAQRNGVSVIEGEAALSVVKGRTTDMSAKGEPLPEHAADVTVKGEPLPEHAADVVSKGEPLPEHTVDVTAKGESITEGRVTGVTVNGEYFPADEVVICAGAWANELLRPLGLHFRVTFQKGQILHLQMPEQPGSGEWPVVIPPNDQYLLAFDHGKMVAGATHENDVQLTDVRVTAGGMHEVLDKGLALAPGLADGELQEVRVGFRPFTPGFLPVIGRVPGWEGLITANGLGASGLTMGPFLGRQLSQLALGLEPDLPLDDYAVEKALEPR
ncbi:NAD(P)/FAD-dependent oxidoreductase [Saccharibacillus kuerlensis]|uniref:Oxidoreductase YurR n=1 Tax=Saccharibacillus kuerlensis TaxID=459527 RepID=A0ABQ2L0H0_9BACL|nr:FAD-dependent oxidoreductase [Saccharibacillus kuerlensis]GGN98604.1 putative oxidoreductase YurR [Saccharibacillus kuerlensis]